MKINISKNLTELSQIFQSNGHPLYIVGGYVRNALLGFCETDIDLCGSATPAEVMEFVPKNMYSIEIVNKKLGTMHFRSKYNDEVYEYTTFRAENYLPGGKHAPTTVQFVRDLTLDAKRRDFTANAIYFDILNGTIIDFYDGQKDTKKHILKTVETPEFVFSSDGLRMLRLVRIACELGFGIDKESLNTAKQMIDNLKAISRERFNKEITSIFFADYKYSSIQNNDAHIRGIKYLSMLGAWPYIFAKLYQVYNIDPATKLKDKNFAMFQKSKAGFRICAFCIEFLKSLNIPITKESISLVLGVDGIFINKKEVTEYTRIILGYLDVLGGFASSDQKRMFVQKNIDIIDDIIGLVDITSNAQDLKVLKNIMIVNKVPLRLKDLAINGNDIKKEFPDLPR
ncbi:MAG: CCA tRNA nucleotidyltransferase, partial [Clostridia bacterium]|nr:CCA tRNA nucleotidyltransferase [Clostridia bacterium]